jgi:hypothetical protein
MNLSRRKFQMRLSWQGPSGPEFNLVHRAASAAGLFGLLLAMGGKVSVPEDRESRAATIMRVQTGIF